MKKCYVVRKNWEFQKIIDFKKQYISKVLILYYCASTRFQIGISIPKKFAKATQRNFLKRQIRAILESNKENLIQLPYKVVLIVRKDFIDLDFQQKKFQVEKILNKLINPHL